MKYFITILLLLSVVMYGIIYDFSLIINISFTGLIIVTYILWEYSVLKNDFPANFTMKSYGKNFDKSNLLLAIMWSFFFIPSIYEDGFNTFAFSGLVIWILIVLLDVFMNFVYKKKKPTTIFIDGDTLVYNNRWIQKRNLNNLNYIGITKYWNEIELGFKKKSDVKIPFKEYKPEEVRHFLDMLVEKSEHDVYLTDNVLKKFPSPILETVD